MLFQSAHGASTGASAAAVEFEVGALVGGFVWAGCHITCAYKI